MGANASNTIAVHGCTTAPLQSCTQSLDELERSSCSGSRPQKLNPSLLVLENDECRVHFVDTDNRQPSADSQRLVREETEDSDHLRSRSSSKNSYTETPSSLCTPRQPCAKLPCKPPGRRSGGWGGKVNVVVMRHGERFDQSNPNHWYNSEAAKRFPHDAPVTERGRAQAVDAAQALSQRFGNEFSMVVTSPYMRCVGTAVEVCRYLRLPLCIDQEIGEVYGPMCFGDCQDPAGPPRRSMSEVEALLPSDVRLLRTKQLKAIVGCPPKWPESIEDARLRMVGRVEQYAGRAARVGGASFILVTHADCVAACLTLALAGQAGAPEGRLVDKVNYCGFASFERSLGYHNEPDLGLMDEDAGWIVNHTNVTVQHHGWAWDNKEGHRSFDPKHLEAEAKALREKRRRFSETSNEMRPATTMLSSNKARDRSQQALGFQEYVGGAVTQNQPSLVNEGITPGVVPAWSLGHSLGIGPGNNVWNNVHDMFAEPLTPLSPLKGAQSGSTPLLMSSHEAHYQVLVNDEGWQGTTPIPRGFSL